LLWSGGEPGSVERRRRGDGEYVREPPSSLRSVVEWRGRSGRGQTGSIELKKIFGSKDGHALTRQASASMKREEGGCNAHALSR
jgi:hypothetical protein